MPVSPIKPIAVPVRKVGRLAGHGHDRTYDLIKAGEYESFLDGGRRFVTMASIEARQARLIAETGNTFKPAPFKGQPEGKRPKGRGQKPSFATVDVSHQENSAA
jgi:hypothetical protein